MRVSLVDNSEDNALGIRETLSETTVKIERAGGFGSVNKLLEIGSWKVPKYRRGLIDDEREFLDLSKVEANKRARVTFRFPAKSTSVTRNGRGAREKYIQDRTGVIF